MEETDIKTDAIVADSSNAAPRKRRRRWLWAAVAVVIVLLVVTGLALKSQLWPNTAAAIPATVRSQVSFPVYYPSSFPAGMSIDKTSFSATSQVLTYTVFYADFKKLQISIQPRSPDIDPETYDGDSSFTTSIGKAVIVDMDDRTTAAVFGQGSWLLINAPNTIPDDQLRDFINSLQQI